MEKTDKLIYLDWNIFQDIKQNRNAEDLKNILSKAKQRNYIFPYSYSHIRDLSRSTNKEYIDEDLKFISMFCDNYCLHYNADNENDFYIEKKNSQEVMEYLKQQNAMIKKVNCTFLFPRYRVDMNKISQDNILFPYLEKNNFIMSPELINTFAKSLYPVIFENYQMQKKFKNSLEELIKINCPAFQEVLNLPIYKHFLSDRCTIMNNFSEIFNSFLSLSNKSQDKIKFGEQITTASNMLDFLPAFSEKINKKNNINNITTDSEHFFWGASSKYYITNDEKHSEKIGFLYAYFHIKTKVYTKKEFVRNITFM